MTTPLPGYTPLSKVQLALMRDNKILEELIYRQVEAVAGSEGVDGRLAAVARTQIELAFLALNKAVARPTRLGQTTPEIEAFEREAELLLAALLGGHHLIDRP